MAQPDNQITIPTFFHKFSKLPPELQLRIWDIVARQDPQVLLLSAEEKITVPNGRVLVPFWTMKSSHQSLPGIFGANFDSRTVAMKYFKLCFADLNLKGFPLYFNPEIDKVLYETQLYDPSDSRQTTDLELVKHIGFSSPDFGLTNGNTTTDKAHIFKGLETVNFSFVVKPDNQRGSSPNHEEVQSWWTEEVVPKQEDGTGTSSGPVVKWLDPLQIRKEWLAGFDDLKDAMIRFHYQPMEFMSDK